MLGGGLEGVALSAIAFALAELSESPGLAGEIEPVQPQAATRGQTV